MEIVISLEKKNASRRAALCLFTPLVILEKNTIVVVNFCTYFHICSYMRMKIKNKVGKLASKEEK